MNFQERSDALHRQETRVLVFDRMWLAIRLERGLCLWHFLFTQDGAGVPRCPESTSFWTVFRGSALSPERHNF